jgi:hypothetical protein
VCTRGSNRALLGGPSTSPLVAMASFVAFVIFWAAVVLYAVYVFRRILGRGQLSRRDWPRGWRLAAYVSGLLLAVVVVVPAAIMVAGYVFGMTNCTADYSPSQPWRCSQAGRLLFITLSILVGLPLVAMLLRWLAGFVYRSAKP